MTEDEFKNLGKAELLAGAKHCYVNAVDHLESAQGIAKFHKHHIATSLLILGAEESIKGYVLLAGFFNIPLPFKIAPLFRQHPPKHLHASEIQPMVTLIATITAGFGRTKKQDVLTFVQIAMDMLMNHGPNHFGFSEWWKNANNLKNKGFYVDFIANSWQGENRISLKEYQQTLYIVTPLINGLQILKKLKPEDYKLMPLK